MIGYDQESVIHVVDHVKTVIGYLGHNRNENQFSLREVAKKQGVAVLASAALRYREHREPFVLRGLQRMEALWIRFVLVNQPVFCLRATQAVVVNPVSFVAGG